MVNSAKPVSQVRVAFPVEPVQVRGQLRRRDVELDRVVEAAAVHRPQLAADALPLQVFVDRRRQAGIEEDEIERGADPGDRGDEMGPAQQQVGPVQQIAFHVIPAWRPAHHCGRSEQLGREQQDRLRCDLRMYKLCSLRRSGRSGNCSNCAATLTAITSGSLPAMPGRPIGQVTWASSLSAKPRCLEPMAEGRPFGRAADQADEGAGRRARAGAAGRRPPRPGPRAWLKLMISTRDCGARPATARLHRIGMLAADVGRQIGRKDLVAAVDPGDGERQRRQRVDQRPADVAAAEQGHRCERRREPRLQRCDVGSADALEAQAHHAAAALAQARAQRDTTAPPRHLPPPGARAPAPIACNSRWPPPMVPTTIVRRTRPSRRRRRAAPSPGSPPR